MLRSSFVLASFLLVIAGSPAPAGSLFHFAVIDEFMTSYADDPDIQFVEIEMRGVSQNSVQNSVLAAFDPDGVYIADVLVVPSGVPLSGNGVSWIMGTQAFETLSGVSVDFVFLPGLPTVGGMVCWGAPGILPPPPSAGTTRIRQTTWTAWPTEAIGDPATCSCVEPREPAVQARSMRTVAASFESPRRTTTRMTSRAATPRTLETTDPRP